MGKQNVAFAIEQKIAAGLIDVIAPVGLSRDTAPAQCKIKRQCSGRKHFKPCQPFQAKCRVDLALGIGEQLERPCMPFLIGAQLRRLGEGNRNDGNAAAIKFGLERAQLAEMSLAWQSRQVPEKNQQNVLCKMLCQYRPATLQIQQRQAIEIDSIHPTKLNQK